MTTKHTQSNTKHPDAKAKGADAYRDPSWWYDIRGFFILMGTYQVFIGNHLSFFARNLGNRHLEAAIGSGTFLALTLITQRLKGRTIPDEIVGIDYAESMLNGAKKLFRNKKNIHLIQADLSKIDFPDAYFDSVNIAHSFHAFPEPEKVLKELFRVMKPGANLYVDVLLAPQGGYIRKAIATKVNNFCFRKGILARTCNLEETQAQFKNNQFEIVDSYIKGNTFHLIARKP
ncbi:MAG: methyltransferase domain-containing protein [Methylococcaceae bacterium]|nr:methyltransferase domain-containing protein [Methylococcaceae bacterium]